MKEEIMLTSQSRNLLGILSMNGSTAGIFQTLKRQATTAGFFAYAGIISAALGLWMWLWRDTTIQDKTLARTVGAALVLASFFIFPHLRRGFGTFFLILTSTGIGIAVYYSNRPLIHGDRADILAIFLIATGMIVYFVQTLYTSVFLLLLALFAGIIGVLWFNPAFFNPIVMVFIGGVFILTGILMRYLALLNSFI
jgi:hypothetical protein